MNSVNELLYVIIFTGIIAVFYSYLLSKQILKASPGNAKMQEIAEAIQIGAKAYLKRQYITIAIVGLVVLAIVSYFFSPLVGLGYFIGASFLDLSMGVVKFYGYENKVIDLKESLSLGTGFYIWLTTLFLAGFTPLPFKVFTITSGMISFNLLIFFFICLVSRGLRFFIVSYLSFTYYLPEVATRISNNMSLIEIFKNLLLKIINY